jgi:hypothetical protein
MDIRVLILILTIIGSINLCLEEKRYGGWKQYFFSWARVWVILYVIFGFIHWIFNTQPHYQLWWMIRFISGHLIMMLLLNAKICLDTQEDDEGYKYSGASESELPIFTAIFGVIAGVIWLIFYGVCFFIR